MVRMRNGKQAKCLAYFSLLLCSQAVFFGELRWTFDRRFGRQSAAL